MSVGNWFPENQYMSVLNLHEEKQYCSQFKIWIALTKEKLQDVEVFAIAGENTYIQSETRMSNKNCGTN